MTAASDPRAVSRRPPARSPGPRLVRATLFKIVLVTVPVLLLACLEIVLRICGVGAPPPLFEEVRVGTVAGYITNPAVGRRYFPPEMEELMPRLGFQFFSQEKGAPTFRVFALGGSSTAGFPYHSHGSFTGILGTQLRQLLPGWKIETVNCAMTAVNSHTVRDFVPEILRHEPDLLLVYMGHNEFYGARGVGSLTAGPLHWGRPVIRLLLDLRISAVLRSALRVGWHRPARAERRNVMETMAAEREIRADSPLRSLAFRQFERNLRALLEDASSGGVPVLLCTVASNLRAQPPFGSAHPEDFAGGSEFSRHWAAAQAAWAAGDAARALADLDGAVALDSSYAAARYLRAQILDRSGQTGPALADYRAAREYDTVPFRAPAAINTIIRRVAGEVGVPVVDVDSLIAAQSPGQIPGGEFFLEHLHPNLEGHALIAAALARRLSALERIAPRAAWRWERDLTVAQYLDLSGVTDLDREIGDQRIHMLTQKWPYRRVGHEPTPYSSSREERVIALAADFVRKRVPLNEAHQALGDYYAESGRVEEALREYRSAFVMFPVDPAAAARLGQLLLATGRPRAARHYLDLAVALAPHSESARVLLVQALVGEGEEASALVVGTRALQLHPQSAALRALVDTLRTRVAPSP